MNSGIYKIRNLVNGKCYVGSTKSFTKRKQDHFRLLKKGTHWNVKLQRAFDKYGISAFVFEICELAEYNKSIVMLEDQWIHELDAKKNGYNIADASFGDQLSHHPDREAIIEKIKTGVRRTLNSMSEEERRKKFGKSGELNPMFGVKRPEYIHASMKAGIHRVVQETGHGPTYGIRKSTTHCEKLSLIAQQRTGDMNSFFGKKHSEQSKSKMSIAATGRKCPTARPVIMNGVRYEKLKDAADAAGVHVTTIHYRASSKNPKFHYVYFEDTPK